MHNQSLICIVLASILTQNFVPVANAADPLPPTKTVETTATEVVPPPPNIVGKAYILIDYATGQVLAEHNADRRLEPASLTKVMSMDVVFRELTTGHIKIDDQVPISEYAWKTSGSRTFADVGKTFRLEDLLKGAIIQSGNDATVALAEHVAGSESTFAEMMNAHARTLGLTNSHFVNATGLPNSNHYSSARDMAKIGAATIRNFPAYYTFYSIKEYELNKIKQPNRNLLLYRDSTVDGIKTGHTQGAGFCLMASAKRNNQRLISVIMGSSSMKQRAADSLALLNYGFRFYETHKLYDKNQVLHTVRVLYGSVSNIQVGTAAEVYITVPREQYGKIEIKTEITPSLKAPVAKNQQVGKVLVSLGQKQIAEIPLVALEESAEGGVFRQLIDAILYSF